MTEQQIREQTQAVFDAYLALSRCGISLSDFLEIRREAIQELAAVTDTGDSGKKETDNPSVKIEKKKKKPQREITTSNRKTESPKTKALDEEDVSVSDVEEESEEAVIDDSDETAEDYSDFLDEFSDPWN